MDEARGLVCDGCGTRFSLSFDTDIRGNRSISVTIEWECPHCTYKNIISPVIFMCAELAL